jgi:hypothetical protein
MSGLWFQTCFNFHPVKSGIWDERGYCSYCMIQLLGLQRKNTRKP